jgi:hypothetical protein
MAIADRTGLPIAACIASASPAEVTLVDETLDSGFLANGAVFKKSRNSTHKASKITAYFGVS